MTSAVRSLATEAARKRMSKVARERLERDVELVRQRLRKNQYEISAFGNNKYNIPDRADEFFKELEFHCIIGQSWSQALKAVDLSKILRVADLGAGYSPKIELGLFYQNYEGEVFVVDKNTRAIEQLKLFMGLFRPRFKIRTLAADLFAPPRRKFGLVLANHLLDDLVMDYWCSTRGISSADIYNDEHSLLAYWNELIASEKEIKERCVPLIANSFSRLCERSGTIVFTQYESYVERLMGFRRIKTFHESLAESTAAALSKKNFRDISSKIRSRVRSSRFVKSDDFYALRSEE